MHDIPKIMMEIKNKTDNLHKASENSGFIKRLMDKKATKETYAEYIYNLQFAYEAIEANLIKHKDVPEIKDFYTVELFKTDLIKKDIEALMGSNERPELLSSTVAYVARLNELSDKDPKLVIAHAYTRFLADLFGGRIFFGLLKESYGLNENELNYYSFDHTDDIRTYVMGYHGKIMGLNLEGEIKELFINEISNSYIFNMAISNELESKYFKEV